MLVSEGMDGAKRSCWVEILIGAFNVALLSKALMLLRSRKGIDVVVVVVVESECALVGSFDPWLSRKEAS